MVRTGENLDNLCDSGFVQESHIVGATECCSVSGFCNDTGFLPCHPYNGAGTDGVLRVARARVGVLEGVESGTDADSIALPQLDLAHGQVWLAFWVTFDPDLICRSDAEVENTTLAVGAHAVQLINRHDVPPIRIRVIIPEFDGATGRLRLVDVDPECSDPIGFSIASPV